MGGIDLGAGGSGARKSLDSEINMIPMIDLLMVTISFLLITAVWTHMARLDASAQVPGRLEPGVDPKLPPEAQLHVTMRGADRFTLAWKQGNTTVDSIDVPRRDVVAREGPVEVVRFPELARRIESEWTARGRHASSADTMRDRAVLHTDDSTEFKYVVGVMDAIHQTSRTVNLNGRAERMPAFDITFATN
jgi:biopolymer transport protein ExbD